MPGQTPKVSQSTFSMSELPMAGRRIVHLLCAMAVAAVAIAASPGVANTTTFEQCPPSAFIAPDGDLRVELGRSRIAFAGRVGSMDEATLRTELAAVLDANEALKGRPVCLSLRTQDRPADYVTASIPDVVGALSQVSGSAVFRAMWGGGGMTVVGWMKREDKVIIQRLGSGLFPVDAGVVGLFEDLPAKVRLRVEGVNISSSRVLQIEQYHPRAGLITLSTTSKIPLRACPGGWRGHTPTAIWKSKQCVTVNPGRPTVLAGSRNDHTHLSLAIRPTRGSTGTIDVDLRYTAIDTAYECYIGGNDHLCTLLPPRLAA